MGTGQVLRFPEWPISLPHPKHPERICWGCDKLCPAEDLRCGNGSIRSPHPVELFGEDWRDSLRERESVQPEPVSEGDKATGQ